MKDIANNILQIGDNVAFCKGNQLRLGKVVKLTNYYVIIIENISNVKCQIEPVRVLKCNI